MYTCYIIIYNNIIRVLQIDNLIDGDLYMSKCAVIGASLMRKYHEKFIALRFKNTIHVLIMLNDIIT